MVTLRVVHTQVILFLKSMSERGGSDIDFENKMAWVWTILKTAGFLRMYNTIVIYGMNNH